MTSCCECLNFACLLRRWYKVLDKNVMPDNPRSNTAVLIKTAADQLVWAPLMTVVFFAVLKTLEGHPELIMATVQVGIAGSQRLAWACCLVSLVFETDEAAKLSMECPPCGARIMSSWQIAGAGKHRDNCTVLVCVYLGSACTCTFVQAPWLRCCLAACSVQRVFAVIIQILLWTTAHCSFLLQILS